MIRPPKPTDQGYIASTWARSILRSTHAWQRHASARSGHQVNTLIDKTLDRKDTRALLRVKPHDPDSILGWVLFVDGVGVPVIHYVYVRRDDRQSGIATELLYQAGVRWDAGVVCTSDGPDSHILRVRYPAATYVPLAEFLNPKEAKKI
jgi:hypothetical protein